MRGIAVIGGESPAPEALRIIAAEADLLAAADSGLIACEDAGLKPDWVVGDMDSLDKLSRLDKYPPRRVMRFPCDKDYTDTELALALLREKGCSEIWIAGGGGGRLDHLFGLRALFEMEEGPDRWFPGNEEILCIKEGWGLKAEVPAGSIISVFPLGKKECAAGSRGLKWPLDNVIWKCGYSGVSNVATEGSFEISSIKGHFMVIMPIILDSTKNITVKNITVRMMK